MMTELVLVEGVSDVQLISYFIHSITEEDESPLLPVIGYIKEHIMLLWEDL